ncbi:MAG: NIPSNAP family protein [Verrucomicrobiota bacterium]
MKSPRLVISLLLACFALALPALAAPAAAPVYELRTYTSPPGKRDALLARFREHTLALFEKHGMKNVIYWVPAEAKDDGENKLIYLLEHKSRDAATASWKAFLADPVWKEVNKKTTANGPIVSKVESVFLAPTDFAKSMTAGAKAGGAPRVFELRTYTTPEGKLPNLDARFRDHTAGLFAKHGMTNLGYFHPLDADKGAANTLIYFLAYPSRDAATAAWKGFRDDADWAKARTASEKDGKITTKVVSVFLTPTDFSPIK